MYHHNDPMKAYMQDIGEIPLITKEEEIELARRIKAGDYYAKQKLINANLRLVVKIAHDFKGIGLPLLDLIAEGNIGLMRAAEKFDPAKGAKFSSYSAWWIKQAMRRALSQKSRTIRVPVASAGKISKIRVAKVQLNEKFGRIPTDQEIATHLDMTKRTILGLKMADLKTFSMHDPIQKGEDGNFEDIIADTGASTPDDIIENVENVNRLRKLITYLDEREQKILILRYGLDGNHPKTLEEVSVLIGRTRERVRQIQMQSLKKLKNFIDNQQIDNNGNLKVFNLKFGSPNGDSGPGHHNGTTNSLSAINQGGKTGTRKNGIMSMKIPMINHFLEDTEIKLQKAVLCSCSVSIDELPISRRSLNGLHSANIHTVAQLIYKSADDLLNIRYFGTKCLIEVQEAVEEFVSNSLLSGGDNSPGR